MLTMFPACFPQEDDLGQKVSALDDVVVDRLESEFEQMNNNEKKALRHKVGVLGVYFRIYKELLPVAGGERGYLYRFPEPVSNLDTKLSRTCDGGLSECINEILLTIQSSHRWLYPSKSRSRAEIELSSAVLKGIITDNLLTTEISATQILCFLALRRNPVFEQIPFCRYRLENNSTKKLKITWPGHLLQKSPQLIDELYGAPYQCAYESFCPDPCCHGVQASSPLFISRKCALNKCLHKDRCRIEPAFNDDFMAMRENKWNVSCPCGKGLMYRPDIESCVHSDLCSEFRRCPATFDCINTIADPGYKCICQLGYIKNNLGQCIPIGMSSSNWHGFAFSEPHPQASSPVLVLLPFSIAFIISFS
ncbi:hypothetical protein Y032_0314g2241 [Ancylostoma ceylanicum]|nr:hypothetical protein Y032_0314g2241 [Ancylostoma ceylanicum]